MVGGFNTNIRYRGRTFHVQTEDRGATNPQIITLLYEGGAILSVSKRSYDESLACENLDAAVRSLMEEQHRSVVQGLKSGGLDEMIGLSSGERRAERTPPERERACEFGEGIISDTPLGDVILSHLAER